MLRNPLTVTIVLALALCAADNVGQKQGEDRIQTRERRLRIGEEDVKQLLLLMDVDGNGKISREEYMNFMAAEFDRLDKDENGELDINELRLSRLRVSHPVSSGK